MKNASKILEESGCFRFLDETADRVLEELTQTCPDGFSLLTPEARDGLRRNCRKRLESLYLPALAEELRRRKVARDPINAVLVRDDPALDAQIAGQIVLDAQGHMDTFLHGQFPLAADYEAHIVRNFRDSWIEFFDTLADCREEIGRRLLRGGAFTKIERFSAFGGDQHRHGRAVTGVWTDAGVFYYKPHECGLDAAYCEIVKRWFADSTAAAEVVQKNKVAFVSCLEPAPVEQASGLSAFYTHFGVLTALLFGLGSVDIHLENIMACGDRPSLIDIETLISPSYMEQARTKQLEPSTHNFGPSVMRTGILPVRMYGRVMHSPLYSERKGSACLPVFEGKTYTAEGHEEEFIAGFRDGYGRLLAHREEIMALLRTYGGSTVRCMMRNTAFYCLIQQRLYRQDALQSRQVQEAALHRLALPFEQTGAEVFREQVDHEAACLLMGDIPYFCTAADGTDLCGDNPGETVRAGYFSGSPLEMTKQSLDRLSAEDLRFEEALIRVAFAHAALDTQTVTPPRPIAAAAAKPQNVTDMALSLFRSFQKDAIPVPEGGRIWMSTMVRLRGYQPLGDMGVYAEAGAFCAKLLSIDLPAELRAEAMETARECVHFLRRTITDGARRSRETVSAGPCFPTGLYAGFGGVLWGLGVMSQAGVEQADETAAELVHLLIQYRDMWHPDATAARGVVGLTLALDSLTDAVQARDACMRLCADALLAADVPSLPDADTGAAGIAAALAAAYGRLGDARCAEKACEIMERIRGDYDSALQGWPDSAVKLCWMADRGTQAAGIALAADYAAKRLPAPAAAEQLRETALLSLRSEQELYRFDTLEQGNALTVLCLLRVGETERAGRVLEAMRLRAESEGSFLVTAPGIRSFFDPSVWFGSLGVGLAAVEYLHAFNRE